MTERSSFRDAVRQFFAQVATERTPELGFHSGRLLALSLGYPQSLLDRMPPEAVESFVGVGNPFLLAPISGGEFVLDIGCGAGFDCIIAAQIVGETGCVLGIDLTPEMVRKARDQSSGLGLKQAAFVEADAESLPVRRGSFDVVMTNAAILFAPDKDKVFAQAYEALKPGGRLLLADVLIPDSLAAGLDALALMDRGFLMESEYLAALEDAGFEEIDLMSLFDTASGALSGLGLPDSILMGASIRAQKPG